MGKVKTIGWLVFIVLALPVIVILITLGFSENLDVYKVLAATIYLVAFGSMSLLLSHEIIERFYC